MVHFLLCPSCLRVVVVLAYARAAGVTMEAIVADEVDLPKKLTKAFLSNRNHQNDLLASQP